MQWIKSLQIAIAEENENQIDHLINHMPDFDSLEEMQDATYIIREAYQLLIKRKEETAQKLLKLQKQKEFLHSSRTQSKTFDQTH